MTTKAPTVDDLGARYRELTAARDAVLAELRPHVLRMYRDEELTAQEIATRTGLTRGGIYAMLAAAGVPRARGARNAATARAAQAATVQA